MFVIQSMGVHVCGIASVLFNAGSLWRQRLEIGAELCPPGEWLATLAEGRLYRLLLAIFDEPHYELGTIQVVPDRIVAIAAAWFPQLESAPEGLARREVLEAEGMGTGWVGFQGTHHTIALRRWNIGTRRQNGHRLAGAADMLKIDVIG